MSSAPIPNRILALDYGRAHTGTAISDPTGTIVRPLGEINAAGTPDGLNRILEMVDEHKATMVVVGMPMSLKGGMSGQSHETGEFIRVLRTRLRVPVISWDERFTSRIAGSRCRFSGASKHSLAACILLEDYLNSEEFRKRS